MLTKAPKRRKLSHEILGITFLCLLVSFLLCWALWGCSTAIVHYVYEMKDITLTDIDIAVINNWVLSLSLTVSALFFALLFLIILGERLVYIRKISHAIHSFDDTEKELILPLEGSNELTDLAETINLMTYRSKQIRQKEKKLNEERQELVRSLSHDIRTPLTSVMSYSQLLLEKEELSPQAKEYADNIYRKSLQIKELTDILLDMRKNNVERVENIYLLFEQFVCDFEAELEDDFKICTDLENCPKVPCEVDISELRRIFDNLVSNILKYADPAQDTVLKIYSEGKYLVIKQSNGIIQKESQGTGIGLKNIRRIANNYGGEVSVNEKGFEIKIKLSIL